MSDTAIEAARRNGVERQKWLAEKFEKASVNRIAITPLEWEAFEGEGEPNEWYARSPCGTFYIEYDGDRYSMYSSKSSDAPMRHFPFREDAEVAAQADFEARIRSALVISQHNMEIKPPMAAWIPLDEETSTALVEAMTAVMFEAGLSNSNQFKSVASRCADFAMMAYRDAALSSSQGRVE